MKVTFLENGIDSLQKGFHAFLDFEIRTVSSKPTVDDYLVLKQAVLSTHHGVEILMKYILARENESFIVDHIDEAYIKACSEKKQLNKNSLFETSCGNDVHTISYSTALNRINALSKVIIPKDFLERLRKLEIVRNSLTHAEIDISDKEIVDIFPRLLSDLDTFFFKMIGKDYKTISGYDVLQRNYDEYMKILNEKGKSIKKNAIDVFRRAFEKADILIGFNEIKRINDVTQAKKFVGELNQNHLSFGLDMYNGWCSGNLTIRIIDDSHFSFVCLDNKGEYVFRFKSIIAYMPEPMDSLSPILIFESGKDKECLQKLEEAARSAYEEDDYIEGFLFEDGRESFNYAEMNEIYSRMDYDEYYEAPKFRVIDYFLIDRVIAALNIQGLPYWNFHNLLKAAEGLNGHQLEVQLRGMLK